MGAPRDLTGLVFGELTVVRRSHKIDKHGGYIWECVCTCGSTAHVRSGNLIRGGTTSCGCKHKLYSEEAHVKGLKRKDLVGRRFGGLVVLSFDRTCDDRHRVFWSCVCDCGNVTSIRGDSLKSGKIVSCGCYKNARIGVDSRTHGQSRSKLYNKHQQMLKRCYNRSSVEYPNYGGRGITVCDRWRGTDGFLHFLSDMGEPAPGLSIDRINNDGPYSPENCRWATKKQQASNRRTSLVVSFRGVNKCLAEWCRLLNLRYGHTRNAIARGVSLESIVGGSL